MLKIFPYEKTDLSQTRILETGFHLISFHDIICAAGVSTQIIISNRHNSMCKWVLCK